MEATSAARVTWASRRFSSAWARSAAVAVSAVRCLPKRSISQLASSEAPAESELVTTSVSCTLVRVRRPEASPVSEGRSEARWMPWLARALSIFARAVRTSGLERSAFSTSWVSTVSSKRFHQCTSAAGSSAPATGASARHWAGTATGEAAVVASVPAQAMPGRQASASQRCQGLKKSEAETGIGRCVSRKCGCRIPHRTLSEDEAARKSPGRVIAPGGSGSCP